MKNAANMVDSGKRDARCPVTKDPNARRRDKAGLERLPKKPKPVVDKTIICYITIEEDQHGVLQRMHPRPRETKLAAKKHGLLNEIFRLGGCSRLELARRLNINATMVGKYVNEFLERRLLVEQVVGSSTRGPVPIIASPQPSAW